MSQPIDSSFSNIPRRFRQQAEQVALKPSDYPNVITPANITWQTDDTGNQVPISGEFGDVYFSHADGLAESRYVFVNGNQLPERLAQLAPYQCFTIAELGFGTGLNFLAVWQLWQQLRDTHSHLNSARLHFISTELHPITLPDLTQILRLWSQRAPELAELIEPFLTNYPPLIAGCHRLNFSSDNLTLDIWLGDAAQSLAKLSNNGDYQPAPYIDAWFLDGFAPSCNEALWAQDIFVQMQRLSQIGTTAATYSSAGIVKRSLQDIGFRIKKIAGFGRKREMLTAVMVNAAISKDSLLSRPQSELQKALQKTKFQKSISCPTHSVVIGAGVAGLMTAWSLANRGIKVTLLDKDMPLSGASGNPRALLAPKMTPIHHVDEHLHTISYLYTSRFYRYLNEQASIHQAPMIFEPTGALELLVKSNVSIAEITDYPDSMAITLSSSQAKWLTGLNTIDLSENLYLPKSGLVNTQAVKNEILRHPLITFKSLIVKQISETPDNVIIHVYLDNANNDQDNDAKDNGDNKKTDPIVETDIETIAADNVIICAAFEGHQIDSRIANCRTIRGQLSWFSPTTKALAELPKIPLKYSGYCAPFIAQTGDDTLNTMIEGQPQFLLGASFIDADIDTSIRPEDNQQNRDKLITDIPELDDILPIDTENWQARAGIRTQTIDYHPLVGLLAGSQRIWTLSAMGAKGYAIAPLCSETLVDMMLGTFPPVSANMVAKISPNRARVHKNVL